MVSRDARAGYCGGRGRRKPSRGLRAVAFVVGLVVAAASARAEIRVALVVGNGAYATAPLANPKPDADLMAKTLGGVGFEVIKLIDGDAAAMRRAFVEFGRRLKAKDSVGVFYFAGHGVQVAGQNYLVPVGADIRSEAEVALQALNLNELLTIMRGADSAAGGRMSVAILDACRDNPFSAAVRSTKGGLAAVSAPQGTLIAYATAPGGVASDGTDGHSPYTAALARSLPTPGLGLEDVFKRTREQVLKATKNAQTPWEHSSLTGSFIFVPKAASPEPSNRLADMFGGRRLKEIGDWEKVKDSGDPARLKAHVQAYPGGAYEELAHYKIGQIERPPAAVAWWKTGGNDVAAVRSEADTLFERAVKLDVAGATTDDLKAARELYSSAAKAGVVTAMLNLARLHDKGRGGPVDLAEAVRLFASAADAGSPAAQAALGTMHEYGEGVPQSLVEAFRLYRLAADKADPAGLASLGYLYAQGKGVARDFGAARKWYLAAAEQGHPRAQFNLALLLIRGEGGPIAWPDAVRWLRAAANSGHAGALRELAYLHDEGRGVPRDAGQAAAYLIESYKARTGGAYVRATAADRREAWSRATRQALQRQLAASNRYSGKVNGRMDEATRQALEGLGKSGSD
jgi:TPR repeat protein